MTYIQVYKCTFVHVSQFIIMHKLKFTCKEQNIFGNKYTQSRTCVINVIKTISSYAAGLLHVVSIFTVLNYPPHRCTKVQVCL